MLNRLKSLKNNQEFMKYFTNTSWLFFDKIFKMGVGFFLIIYLTRYLGPEKFGILSYSQSFVSIFMAFASLGISQVLIRDLVKYKDKKYKLLGSAFFLTFTVSTLSILMIFLFEVLSTDQTITKNIILILSFTIIFQNFNMLIDSYFQHKVLSKKIVYVNSISFIVSSSIKFYLIYIKAKLIYFGWALLFDMILLSILFLYIYSKENESIKLWKVDFKIVRKYLKVAMPLTMVAVSAFIYTRIDQIMIKYMLDNEAVGNYAAAIRVSELFYFIPGIIVTSLFPKLVEVRKENKERYLKLLEKTYRLVVWIAIPIALFLFSFSDFIVSILYGDKFIQASEILKILSFSIIFAAVSAVFVKMLYIEHWEKKYMYKSIFGVIVNIILNYILISLYGANGAAIATLITIFSINYIYDLFDVELREYYLIKLKAFNLYKGFR